MVIRAVGSGFMNGYSGDRAGYFGPNDPVTRGQVATILWNLQGNPAPEAGAKTFPDVGSGAYYSTAVAWASSVGVVNGYGDGSFKPNKNVTREELATMLRNYARYRGVSMEGSSADSYAAMSDAGSVSNYARSSVGWCFYHKILTGTTDGKIMPQGEATRAQAAKMVVMLSELL